jgi:predicted transposase YbfD/YdcC
MKYIILPERLSHSPAFSIEPVPVTTLFQMLHDISDPRRSQGKRHPLPILLTLSILAICCGHDSYEAMADWAVNYQEGLKEKVPFLAKHVPHATTFHRVFTKLEVEELENILGEWIQKIIILGDNEGISLDGKAAGKSGFHLVSAFAHVTRAVLFQKGETTKGKELKAAPVVLKNISLKGHTVTGDALFTQKNLCKLIKNREGGYVFPVKANQKNLQEDIKIFFNDPPFGSHKEEDSKLEKQKGRIEKRTVECSADLNDYINWPGVTHVFRCKRERTEKDKTTTETIVGVARLLKKENPAKQIQKFLRGHWQIENGLFRQRDVVFNEDKSTIRKRGSPQVMAALRNLVTTIFYRASVRSFKKAQRRFAAHPEELFNFMGLPAYIKVYKV